MTGSTRLSTLVLLAVVSPVSLVVAGCGERQTPPGAEAKELPPLPEPARDALARYRAIRDARKFDAATRPVREAIETVPGHPAPHVARGELNHWRGRLAPARESYERALELDPDHEPARTRLDDLTSLRLPRNTYDPPAPRSDDAPTYGYESGQTAPEPQKVPGRPRPDTVESPSGEQETAGEEYDPPTPDLYQRFIEDVEGWTSFTRDRRDALLSMEPYGWDGSTSHRKKRNDPFDIEGRLEDYFQGMAELKRETTASFQEFESGEIPEAEVRERIYENHLAAMRSFFGVSNFERQLRVYNDVVMPYEQMLDEVDERWSEWETKNRFMRDCPEVREAFYRIRTWELVHHHPPRERYHRLMAMHFAQAEDIAERMHAIIDDAGEEGVVGTTRMGVLRNLYPDNVAREFINYGWGHLNIRPRRFTWNVFCFETISTGDWGIHPPSLDYRGENGPAYARVPYGELVDLHAQIARLMHRQWTRLPENQREAFRESIERSARAGGSLTEAFDALQWENEAGRLEGVRSLFEAVDHLVASTESASIAAGQEEEVADALGAIRSTVPVSRGQEYAFEELMNAEKLEQLRSTGGTLQKIKDAYDLIARGIEGTLQPEDMTEIMSLTELVGSIPGASSNALPMRNQLPARMLENNISHNMKGFEIANEGLKSVGDVIENGYTASNRRKLADISNRAREWGRDLPRKIFGDEIVATMESAASGIESIADYTRDLYRSVFGGDSDGG